FLQLLDCLPFRQKQGFKAEEIKIISNWIDAAGITWGKDLAHRKGIFEREYASAENIEQWWGGTWEHGFGRLLEGLTMAAEDAHSLHFVPLDHVEMVHADLLGTLIKLLRSLAADLSILADGTEMTLNEWAIYLQCLLDTYFSCNEVEGAKN